MGYKCYCDESGKFIKQERRDGGFHITYVCSGCGEIMQRDKPFYGIKEVEELGIDSDELGTVSFNHRGPECEVFGCSNIGFQLHHWLPSHLSNNSHLWPIGKLCIEHHEEWHMLTKTGKFRKRNE
jgi:hypothetical protein